MHVCQRCGYQSELKANLKKHLQKKKVCKNTLSSSKTPQQLLIELYPPEKINPSHVCMCGNKYSHLSALYRHRNTCEKYLHLKESEILTEKIQQLEKQISYQTINNNCTTNINSNNTTTNNTIIVNNFGFENISYLTPEFIEKCTCFLSIGLKSMVKAIHLNKHHPENHNIKVTNIKSPYIPVLLNQKWILKDKKEALHLLIEKTSDILRCHFEENRDQIKEKYNSYKRDAIECYHERLEKEDKELWKKLTKEIYLLFVNEKDIFKSSV
jgi:hypothetical protein